MNSFVTIENKKFNEKYYSTTLENGFKITIIPKQLKTSYAMVCCRFGGADIEYKKDGVTHYLPAGTAHFLEHKMFETESGGDSFLEFDKFGGNANAFTSFESTCYYFSCTENFFENLEILLASVSSLHITDASVEKERNIIAREITMYDDSPAVTVSRNLSKAMYHVHPTVYTVSGTVETISNITKETLFRAYEDFYLPANMSLCVCGDIDPEKIKSTVLRYFGESGGKRPETLYGDEPERVKTERVIGNAIVASPLYCIGIKCEGNEKNDLAAFRRSCAMRLAISLTFGRASDYFCKNYENGLLNERFYAGFNQSQNASYVIISGSGNEYGQVLESALAELERRKEIFFSDEQILREKKAAYAESLTLFDSGEDLTAAMALCAHLEYDEFDCIETLRDITKEEIRQALDSLNLSNHSISIIQKGTEL
ncbi:MAG: insulinase family protein [Ruminococcaceae bacterium]|nr:insulinase family protein [Oscillospiraceae bacterium]